MVTLDKRKLAVTLNRGEKIRPDTTKVLPGEGMPKQGDPKIKGNLVIDFDIIYPDDSWFSEKEMVNKITVWFQS